MDEILLTKIKALMTAGFSIEQIAQEYNLQPDELRKELNQKVSPKDELETSLRNTLLDLTQLIMDERKQKSVNNSLILQALKLRTETAEKLSAIKEGYEFWSEEKLRKAVGKFNTTQKTDMVVECLMAMGYKYMSYEEIMQRLGKKNMDTIAKVVDCDPQTVYSGLYKIKVGGWEKWEKKAKTLDNYVDEPAAAENPFGET